MEMTLYEKIIAYGDAREELADWQAELNLAHNQSWTSDEKIYRIETAIRVSTNTILHLIKDIELELGRLSVNER